MSSFLTGLLTSIAEMVLKWIWGDIETYYKNREAQKAAEKEIEDRNKAAREKLDRAETPEERDDAAGDIFRNNGNSPN